MKRYLHVRSALGSVPLLFAIIIAISAALAMEAHKQGHFDTAISEFRRATQTDPSFGQAYLNLGQEYVNSTI
jgi:hypothetical protein